MLRNNEGIEGVIVYAVLGPLIIIVQQVRLEKYLVPVLL